MVRAHGNRSAPQPTLVANPYQAHKEITPNHTYCETCDRTIRTIDWPGHSQGKKHREAATKKNTEVQNNGANNNHAIGDNDFNTGVVDNNGFGDSGFDNGGFDNGATGADNGFGGDFGAPTSSGWEADGAADNGWSTEGMTTKILAWANNVDDSSSAPVRAYNHGGGGGGGGGGSRGGCFNCGQVG